ncbi:MAG: DUF4224 domain-containing protein [Rhodoferax sp.]
MLLTPNEIADLTDIRTGRDGKSREERQLDALKKMKIPYFISAIGRPKVSRSVIDGVKSAPIEESWEPALARR